MRPRKIEIGGGSTVQEQLGGPSLHRGAFGHPAFRFAG